MKRLAPILSITGGLLQLVACYSLGFGVYVFDKSITELFYSPTLLAVLSVSLIVFGVLSFKYPKTSGGMLIVLSSISIFLGSFLFAPVAFVGGVIGIRSVSSNEKYNTKRSFAVYLMLSVLGLLMTATGYIMIIYLWNKAPVKVENIAGTSITAEALAKEYNTDEKAADAKYLNKAIEVSGTVSEVNKNQDGGLMIVLQTGDPTAGIQCSLRDKGANVATGQKLVIKGFCSGNGITGVTLTDCVLK